MLDGGLRTNPAALQIASQTPMETPALLLERQPHKADNGRDDRDRRGDADAAR